MTVAVTNSGTLGTEHLSTSGIDCFTGRALGLGCEVPKNSGVEYLHVGAYWIGAVVGRDTLVSVGLQVQDGLGAFLPDTSPKGDMQKRSIIDPGDRRMFEGAISE